MNPATVTEKRHSVADVLRLIEEEVQARRGMSGKEFLSAYRAGTLKNAGELADLIVLADLLPAEVTP
jgi:hypothetical protein